MVIGGLLLLMVFQCLQIPINHRVILKICVAEIRNCQKGGGQPLPIQTAGGKQKLNCANTEGIFRIIQSIPSKKAEPFKRWLARVGKERIDEIENPEIAQERMKEIYEKKGYSKSWIDKRLRSIAVRQDLTDK